MLNVGGQATFYKQQFLVKLHLSIKTEISVKFYFIRLIKIFFFFLNNIFLLITQSKAQRFSTGFPRQPHKW
jgi:hypothetical protein